MRPTITLSGLHGWQEEPEQLPQAPKNELRQVADTPQYVAQRLHSSLLHHPIIHTVIIHTVPEYPRLYFHLSSGGARQITFEGGPTAGEQAQGMGRRGRKQLGPRDFFVLAIVLLFFARVDWQPRSGRLRAPRRSTF